MKYLFLFFILLLSSIVLAQQTVKTVEIPLDFVAQASANTNYLKDININSPDGIAQILSIEIILKGDFQADTAVRGRVRHNGNLYDCEPNIWTTPSIDALNYEISFDCTDRVKQSGFTTGNKEFGFRTNKVAINIKPYLKVTYYNNPIGGMHVFGTEYRQEEYATIFLQLQDSQGFPVINGSCFFNMYYPLSINTSHEPYLVNTPMLYLEGSAGLYYYDITHLPPISGVYMLAASCSYATGNQFVYYTDGTDAEFPARTEIDGTYGSSPVVINAYTDFLYTTCTAQGGAQKLCTGYYDFDTSLKIFNASSITDFHIFFMGEASTDALVTFAVWNVTGEYWVALPNNLTYTGLAAAGPTGLNDFISNNIEATDVINESGVVRVRVQSSAGTTFDEYINWLNIEVISALGSITDLKGSGEIHINDWFANYTNLISDAVWHWDHRKLTDYEQESISDTVWNNSDRELTNYQEDRISDTVWNESNRTLTGQQQLWVGGTEYSPDEDTGKVVIRLVDSTDNPVNTANCTLRVAYPNNTLILEQPMPYFNGTVMGGIYIADFNLSDTPGVYPYGVDCLVVGGPSPKRYFLLDTFHIFGANRTKTAESVWEYHNRSLSEFDFEINASATVNVSQIWEYGDRTLTAFDFDVNATAEVNSTEIAESVWSWDGSIVANILEQIADTVWQYVGGIAEII